jgi:hypothetical protein
LCVFIILRDTDDDEFWHSSQIAERLSACLLQTASGSLYRLIGPIDQAAMRAEGEKIISGTIIVVKNRFYRKYLI